MACAVLARYKVKIGRVADAIEFIKLATTHSLENGAKSARTYRTSPGGPNTNVWTSVYEFESLQDLASWLEVT